MKINQLNDSKNLYPQNPQNLVEMIFQLINSGSKITYTDFNIIPKILLVPYSSYIYSGLTSGVGYKFFSLNSKIDTLIIIGTCYDTNQKGFILSDYEHYQSPLGKIKVNKPLQSILSEGNKSVTINNNIFNQQYNIQVQLPLITTALQINSIVPILICSKGDLRKLINTISKILKNNSNVGLIISAQLSNQKSINKTRTQDKNTLKNLLDYNGENLDEKCGPDYRIIKIGNEIAKKNGYEISPLFYSTSADSFGNKTKSDGYLSMVYGNQFEPNH